MKRFRNFVLLALCLVVAVGALTIAGSLTGYTKEFPQPANVNVVNTPIAVEVTRKPVKEIYRESIKVPHSEQPKLYNNTNKRLVIETISVLSLVEKGSVWARINLAIGKHGEYICCVPLSFAGEDPNGDLWQGTQQVKVYVEPEEPISIVSRVPSLDKGYYAVSLYGYYEEVPPPTAP